MTRVTEGGLPVHAAPARPLDPGGLVRLFGGFQRHLEQIVRGSVPAAEALVEDACQVAWMELINNRERVAAENAPGWLVTTAIHAALRLYRQEGREDSLELTLERTPGAAGRVIGPDPEEVAWRRQQVLRLRLLSVRQQRLVWLRALGLSIDEMASHEHCTTRTVRRQLERARRTLRAGDVESLERSAA
jgi:RNA polymerase sigma factor (sigma-70 family)